jgi:competence protein ComEA
MVVKNPALDPNAAGLDELSALPGVYPALAERIIDGRPYLEMDDLLKVNGIGTATLEKLRPLLQIKPKPGKKNPAREVKPKAAPPVALKTPVEDKSKKPAKLPPRVENLSEVSIMHIPAEDAAVVPLSSPVESQAGLKPLPDENRDVQEWPEEIPVSLDDPGAGRVIELNHEISGGKVAVKNPSQSGAQPETP